MLPTDPTAFWTPTKEASRPWRRIADNGQPAHAGARILIIDVDAPETRELASHLRRAGYEVERASSWRQAERRILSSQPDLILSDAKRFGGSVCSLFHPSSTGVSASACHVPPAIILTSADLETALGVRGLDAGASDFIAKPFRMVEVEARVRATLRTKAQLDALAADAATDPLTGLWNRRYIAVRLTEFVAAAERTDRPLACVMLDLDEFKAINDRLGHQAGDIVLQETARRLRQVVRRSDVPFRFGGEEFMVLAPDTTGHSAIELGERLRRWLSRTPIQVPDVRGRTSDGDARLVVATTSVGVSLFSSGMEASDLLRRADQAMYAAKRAGRNRVVADVMATRSLDRAAASA